ncbi:WD40 repeat-like protein [Fomitiporia mediterranea MF3/22]|uniref:WD40 repeat-like protein n=1 Tax=Fomitiporia mediterranea (strain MF3/22) TaxID=694068 RepID=UPI0004408B94|nr:WD40 repeat-like protein [Fomitiporia mediterranea MF3/22]EJD02440.1 WD40 repeat-like protein [Fomitiporia mediterranea MF3/22]
MKEGSFISKACGSQHLQASILTVCVAIDVKITGERKYSKLQIILEGGSQFRHTSDVVENSLSVQWDSDIYVKSQTKAVLLVQYIKGFRIQRTLDKFDLDFCSQEIGPRKTVTRIGRESLATVELSFGQERSSLDIARWLTPNAVTALGSKVTMLDKLDRVFKLCDLALKLVTGASEVNPFAKAAASIISRVFERFRDIPLFHKELVLILDNVVELLPIVELVLKHVTNDEVRGILQKFFDFVIKLAINLEDYASKPPLRFVLWSWYNPRKDEIHQIKDQLTYTLRSLSLGLQANIIGVATAIDERQLSEIEERALERLWPPENSAYDPSRGCLSGTRRSVLQNVEEWVHSKHHSQRIYWVHGVAGCGKSSVAASVATALDGQKVLSGSFFCKRDIPERRSAGRLLRSLAYFLSRRIMTFRKAVLQQMEDDPVILDKPLAHQFNRLLANPIAAVSREMESEMMVVIVIDALDECEDGETTASHLVSMAEAAHWLRIIITSRPNPRIKENMLRVNNLVQDCDLFEATTDEDIYHFVREQFTSNPGLRKIQPAPIDVLVQRAAGHFIWISTVLKHVSMKSFGKGKLLRQIVESNPGTSSSEGNLDAVYLRVLQDAAQNFTDGEHAVRLIVGLIFVISKNKPLPLEALCAFVPSDLDAGQDELDALLRHLGSVLYEDAQTGAIRVCHPSFLDFVGSSDRSGQFWTAVAELEMSMVERCLQIMLDGLKFNICDLETSYAPNCDVLDLSQRIYCKISRQLQYSCLYWFNHLCRSQTDEVCEGQVQQILRQFLFRTSSLYWLEVLSVMSELGVAIATLEGFLSVSKSFNFDQELVSTASDLYRFVTAFREPMATSAPHIYLSALLWAPVKAMMARRYCTDFNIRQCILKGVNEYWPVNIHTLSVHSSVLGVAYSPDGRHIVSASEDGAVNIWDAQTGAQIASLEGHQGSVESVAYSPDGRHVISGSDDKTLRVWDVETGAQVGTPIEGHVGGIRSVAYSPEGRHIVSGSDDTTVRIWDAETGTQVDTPLEGHQGTVRSVAYSPNGRYIVSGSEDGTVRIWDSQAGAQVYCAVITSFGNYRTTFSVAYSPNGRYIVSGSEDTLRIWDAETGAQVGTPLEGHSRSWVVSVAYSPDGHRIISGSSDKTVRIWDAETGVQVGKPLEGHGDFITSVACSPDGLHIVSSSHDETLRIWDTQTGTQVDTLLEGHHDDPHCAFYSPEGRHIASGSRDRMSRIWDVKMGAQVVTPLKGHQDAILSVAYSPNGRHIVSGSAEKTVRVWDVWTGLQVGTPLEGHQRSATVVVYSPDGRCIVSGSGDKTVRIWDAETGAQVGTPLEGHQSRVLSVSYSPDGRHIVSGSDDKTVRIWDVHIGAQVCAALEGHQEEVESVAYSPNGRYIVSGSSDWTVRIWDAETGAQVGAPLKGHQNDVRSVAYSPDGRHIVSGSDDNTMRIWEVKACIQLATPTKGHRGNDHSVSYLSDGCHSASESDDWAVHMRDSRTSAQTSASLEGHLDSTHSVVQIQNGRDIVSESGDEMVPSRDNHSTNQMDCLHTTEEACEVEIRFLDNNSESMDGNFTTNSGDSDEGEYCADVNGFVWLNEERTGPKAESTALYRNHPSVVPVDGWIRTRSGGLLLWIPHEYRNGICDMSVDCFPRDAPGHPVRLDWSK